MKKLILANEPSIGRVTTPTKETAAWFYNPETTFVARFASKVVFSSVESETEYTYMLLLPNENIDDDSITKAWSIAEDLGSVTNHSYEPSFSDGIYNLEDCEIER